jgi:hypothetical protein
MTSDTTTTNVQASSVPHTKPPGLFERAERLGISKKQVIYAGIFIVAVLFFTVTAILQKRSNQSTPSTSPAYATPTRSFIPNRTSPWYEVHPGESLEGIALSHGYVDSPDATAGQQLWAVGGNRLSVPNYNSNLHKGELIQLW